MALDELDPVLNPAKRLAILGMVAAVARIDFVHVAESLNLTKSDLSKHMSVLAGAGYITVRKKGRGASRRTWYSATDLGKAQLRRQAKLLEQLIAGK